MANILPKLLQLRRHCSIFYNKPSYRFFYPMLTQLAECCLSLPVSNAWPEGGASALKHIKTRLRSRLSNSMLQSLMQMSINGPPINSKETEDIIEDCIKVWTLQKKRRKMPKPPTNTSQENTSKQMMETVYKCQTSQKKQWQQKYSKRLKS